MDCIEKFQDIFQKMDKTNIDLADNLYDQQIEFCDPIHYVHGLPDLKVYFTKLYKDLISSSVHYGEVVRSNDQAAIPWVMTMTHKKLNGKKPFKVAGLSLIHYGEKITRQQDYFDAGSMVYENIPLVGAVIKYIKGRLQS